MAEANTDTKRSRHSRAFDDLPFVAPQTEGRDCWAVQSTGEWLKDYDLGYSYALAFLNYLGNARAKPAISDLCSIVREMMEKRAEPPGAVEGFLHAIGGASMAFAAVPGSVATLEEWRTGRSPDSPER